MGTQQAAGSIELPDQPMDCCISSCAPLIASSLVNGQVLLHRYQAEQRSQAAQAPQGQQQQQQPEEECSTSYATTQVLSRESKKGASCRAVSFCSADDTRLACGFETGTLLLLDVASGALISRLSKAHADGISRLLTLPHQPALVAAGDDGGGLRLWDVRSGQTAMKYSKHTDFITGLAVQEKDQALLAVSGDGTLSVHDLRTCRVLARSETDADDELLSVAAVKGGKKVVCGSQSGVLAIWSWGYWADCSDRFPGHPESVDALVVFDQDTLITGSSDGLLRVVNILPNKLVGVLGAHDADVPVERLALAADRSLLASMSHDTTVKLWDMSLLQDDSGAEEEEEEEEQRQQAAREPGREPATAAAADDVGEGAPADAAASPGKRKQAGAADAGDNSDADDAAAGSDSDGSDDNDDDKGSKKKRKKREKTAIRGKKGSTPASNFFSDLL